MGSTSWTPPTGISVPSWWSSKLTSTGASAMEMTTIGLDLAKHVFQVHGVDVVDAPNRHQRAKLVVVEAHQHRSIRDGNDNDRFGSGQTRLPGSWGRRRGRPQPASACQAGGRRSSPAQEHPRWK